MEPFHLLALLLFVVLAANGESECPKEKTVGETCYELVEQGIDTSQYGCQDGCVYTTGSGQDRVCFKKGDLPVLDTCPAKNQTQENMNERLNLLETTIETLLDMAERSVYQPRPKEQIMDCQNECMMDETIETFKDHQTCSRTCITGPTSSPNQTQACQDAGAPLKGRCILQYTPLPPKMLPASVKIDGNDHLCDGTDECAIYRWKCNTTANIEACNQKKKDVPVGTVSYLAAPFPGKSGTFYYLPLNKEYDVCNSVGTGPACGCIGADCTCDCTCLVFYYYILPGK